MEEEPDFNLDQIEKELSNKDQENSYLRNRSLSMQDAVESNFMPKADTNVIEFKLSSEELLERIEHYLRGDVLKSRYGESNEIETFYSFPTKKITVSLFENIKSKIIYVVKEHTQEKNEGSEDWEVLTIIQGEGEESEEIVVEDNYKSFLLEEIKKGLKGKNKKFISKGNATKEIPDKDRINLNDYGVSEIMNLLSMYINKETFLSWYKEERINEIMADLGDELNKFLLINGKKMGLNTEFKKTKYPLMVITILHTVENAYRRALMGNENRGTREGILITQHQPQQGMGSMPLHAPKKKWSPFDKSTW